jgi:hypothetical protein
MKIYANNQLLAGHLLEVAFTLLRNEGRQPVDAMALAYDLLIGGIDVTKSQRVALHDYLRQVLVDPGSELLSSLATTARNYPNDSQGDPT